MNATLDPCQKGWREYKALLWQIYLLIPAFFLFLFLVEKTGIHPLIFIVLYLAYAIWLQVAIIRFRCPRCHNPKTGFFSGPMWKKKVCRHCGLPKWGSCE